MRNFVQTQINLLDKCINYPQHGELPWCQSPEQIYSQQGTCAINVLGRCLADATFVDLWTSEMVEVLDQTKFALQRKCQADFLHLWNDQPGRTKEEVIELFESVKADLEKELQS